MSQQLHFGQAGYKKMCVTSSITYYEVPVAWTSWGSDDGTEEWTIKYEYTVDYNFNVIIEGYRPTLNINASLIKK